MDVAFAVVPFADVNRPAIGVSLLKAGLARRGFTSRIHYFNIEFADLIGDELFGYVSNQAAADSMLGEWFFADLVFVEQAATGLLPPEHEFVRNVIGAVTPPDMLRRLLAARAGRAAFIERCARTLKDTGAPIIGFTTTFHQTCACLAIARRLKAMPDPPVICFGGANCEGEMGLQMIRSFPWIDYVCTREGDVAFPEFVERYLRAGDPRPLPGLLRRDESAELTYPAMVEDMDGLPIPDYEDYVEALGRSGPSSSNEPTRQVQMQIESARGCWWGAKHHCTFCGLNGDTMSYRSKSPDRVYREIRYIYERYGYRRIDSVDNILDHRYIGTVFPRLVADGIEVEMFYEVKANLKRAQLAALRRGGVRYIQPGIESFSSPVLKLMRKGVSGAQNVQLLKWCEEIDILAAWNILAGFPGEDPGEYARMAALLPLLTHLEPPTGCSPIRLDRFSPLYGDAEAAGLRRVRPTRAYYYAFPLGRRELARLAYFFDFDYADGRSPEAYTRRVQNEIVKWRNARYQGEATRTGGGDDAPSQRPVHAPQRPRLDAFLREAGAIEITDTRECAAAREHLLVDLDAELLVFCDAAQSRSAVARRFAGQPAGAVTAAIERLLQAKLAAEIDGQLLGLPVLRNRPAEPVESEHDVNAQPRGPKAANPQPLLRVL
jgi:ribosomal peptide maturation radical SAM protein 1